MVDSIELVRLDPAVRLAFVQSAWHQDIVDHCWHSFIGEMAAWGVPEQLVDRFTVAGAFEIPLQAKRLADSGRYAAIVGAALVIDGGIYRHEFVAEAVVNGLMRVQLDTGVPVISAVLTPHHFHGQPEHTRFFSQHLDGKGTEVARACVRTIQNLARLPAGAMA